MYKCSDAINGTASQAQANGSYSNYGQMSRRVSEANHCNNRQGPGQHSLLTSPATPCSHQRRWSADFSKCRTSPVITVRKNKKEPPPPQRGVSLLRPHAASQHASKRYSCPPLGVRGSLSSISSSSSTSSCSSPPPVPTSAITGHDPLGWKLHPKSSSTSPRARMNRLSLQIPLPVIIHEPEPSPAPSPAPNSHSDQTANPDPSPKTRPPLRPKPSGRRHSDSSALLKSLPPPLHVVTLEEICAVHLRQVTLQDESDDVFSEQEVKANTRRRKIPPPIPEKTSVARQIAQLMAHSHQHCGPEEIIYTSVRKPKPKQSHRTEDNNRRNAGKTAALRMDTRCDRERSTPRFPG